MFKRSFDIFVSVLLLIAMLPIILLSALLIRISMGKPIFFVQLRPGLQGRPFWLYKFRTMSNARDAEGNLLPDAQRLNYTGRMLRRTSLDELPQLFNVLKGDMSLVGPRPLLMEYLPLYSPEQARRHAVRPGITGWAQVKGRNALAWEERFALDIWYVDHAGMMLDLKILWLTFRTAISGRGVSAEGHATMSKFTGNGTGTGHGG